MSDATTPTNSKNGFGTNRIIACVGFGSVLLGSFALTALGKVSGPEWLGFVQVFAPVAVGTVTGLSAGLKIASILKGK